ncbi:NAD(P)/FAD-dependent oxidoreductase [Pseudonocardiaceae bacterium YIM PH 21723]|nr:NAD(P)/FAD-dependent oxidoreductase [Pseudonocardiaceae bacterium YIM PH 21723]
MRRVVVIGTGMAAARFAERWSSHGSEAQLTLVGDEPAYNRVLLSSVLAGVLGTSDILLPTVDSAQWIRGAATGIDRAAREIRLSTGDTLPYDALVLATGSRAWIPPTTGLAEDGGLAEGVVAFRSMADCEQIIAQVRPGMSVAVLGGGLLGLEAARGLVGRGARVTVIHPMTHVMERQLDATAGKILRNAFIELGVEFRLNVLADKYVPGDGLVLDDGSTLPADLVVVSAGVRAETGLATSAGLDVDRGIVVDDSLRTSDPRIFAIGDCAQHPAVVSGLVQPAWEQAEALADLLTGHDPAARYRGTPIVTRLKARDVDVATLGEVHLDDEDAEVLRLEDTARGRYSKLVLRDGKIAGAILIGAPDVAATVTQLFDQGRQAPEDRLALLLGRAMPAQATAGTASIADLPANALICRCNTVEKGKLVAAWRSGATTVEALAQKTRATTGCGGCRDAVCDLAAWLKEQ